MKNNAGMRWRYVRRARNEDKVKRGEWGGGWGGRHTHTHTL